MKSQTALVYVGDALAGMLTKTSAGYSFQYIPNYVALPEAASVSLSLPLREPAYHSVELFPFFDNLIQEGWLRELSETMLHLDRTDRFNLLVKNGADCAGNITLKEVHDDTR